MRMYFTAILLILAFSASSYAECNISDNRGSNCVNMIENSRVKSGNTYLYRMSFRYAGGSGCPSFISLDGMTDMSVNPGTIVGKTNKLSSITCVESLGCKGFTGWTCKGAGDRGVSNESDEKQVAPALLNGGSKRNFQPNSAKTDECRLIDSYCAQECSDLYTINTSANNLARANDLTAQCLGATCKSFSDQCLSGKNIKKQDVIDVFKRISNNPKYHRAKAPVSIPTSRRDLADKKRACREAYQEWIDIDRSNAKLQAAGAESYADCLAGRNSQRALEKFNSNPANFQEPEVAAYSSPSPDLMPILGAIGQARVGNTNRGSYAQPSSGTAVTRPTPGRGSGRCTSSCNELVRGGP